MLTEAYLQNLEFIKCLHQVEKFSNPFKDPNLHLLIAESLHITKTYQALLESHFCKVGTIEVFKIFTIRDGWEWWVGPWKEPTSPALSPQPISSGPELCLPWPEKSCQAGQERGWGWAWAQVHIHPHWLLLQLALRLKATTGCCFHSEHKEMIAVKQGRGWAHSPPLHVATHLKDQSFWVPSPSAEPTGHDPKLLLSAEKGTEPISGLGPMPPLLSIQKALSASWPKYFYVF